MKTLVILFLFFLSTAQAEVFEPGTKYTVCFTPYQNCTGDIVAVINQAKKSIYLQGYSFTANYIARALIRAQKRGVKVFVILDKSQFTGEHYSASRLLMRNHIPVWNDDGLDIAHNKVMVVDESIVETGSFNYTIAAQRYNAENVLIVYSKSLAKSYLTNWFRRQKVSKGAEN